MARRYLDDKETDPFSFPITRRRFLHGATAAASLLALDGFPTRMASAQTTVLPSPETCGIDHIVLVMMENRSFDHYLGWMDNADGRQAGLRYVDAAGMAYRTYPLAPDYQGCSHPDPDHSYPGVTSHVDLGRTSRPI